MKFKDANDLLVASRKDGSLIKKIVVAVYEAKGWKPGGIVAGTDLWDAMEASTVAGRPYPYACLNSMTAGLGGSTPGRVTTWVSGTGMGKSTVVREIGYAALMDGETVGDVRLEENKGKTGLGYLGLHLNKRLMLDANLATQEERRAAYDATINNGRFFVYDHFGSMDDGDLLGKLRFLIVGCGVKKLILDHISIVVSGMSGDGDERKTIDRLMTAIRSLAENTGAHIHLVCHLRRVANGSTSAEEGGRITLADLRGSQSIAQLSDDVVALERDQQAEGDAWRNVATVRSLKCRSTGYTGVMGWFRYDSETGRTVEVPKPDGDDKPAKGGFKDEEAPF